MGGGWPEQLARLGRLPLVNWYDGGVGRAVWGVSAVGAHVVWGKMMHWQLVKRVGEGYYQIHGLVWDFARKKADELGFITRAWTAGWAWRYSLRDTMPGWCWYRVNVPQHSGGEARWPWWDFRLPGGTDEKKIMSLADKLKDLWHPVEGMHLRASPTEWVVVMRRRWLLGVCYVLMAAGFAVALFALAQLTATQMSWFVTLAVSLMGLASMVVGLGLYFVSTVDLRRMVWWWTMGGSFAEDSETER